MRWPWRKEPKPYDPLENPYLRPHDRMVYTKLKELGNPPKPELKEGEYRCIECSHGILRETSRRATGGGGFDIEQHCDFCNWSEPIHAMGPVEAQLFHKGVAETCAQLRLERPGHASTPEGIFDAAFLRASRWLDSWDKEGKKAYRESEQGKRDLEIIEAWQAKKDDPKDPEAAHEHDPPR